MSRFAAFRDRNFRRYFVGQVDLERRIVAPGVRGHLAGARPHRRSDRLGVAVALQFLPLLLLGAPAGVLADRVDNRRLLMADLGACRRLVGVAVRRDRVVRTRRASGRSTA